MKVLLSILMIIITISPFYATKVVFISNPPYAMATTNNNISFFLMQNIMTELGLDFDYEYTSHKAAMVMIDEEADAIFFPYRKPNLMSNRILLSDTLLVTSHKIFYDIQKHPNIKVDTLLDLKDYIVGSNTYYQHEIPLRRAGLTVHYSESNLVSMQKLVKGEIDVLIEEKIRALRWLKEEIEEENKINIKYLDIDFYPEPFYAIAPVKNENASEVISRINELIKNKDYVDNLVESFFR